MPGSPEELLKEYERSLSSQDFDRVRPLIHEDAVFWFNDGSFRGHEEIEGAFAKTFDLIKEEKFWLTDIEWLFSSEETAACHYQFNWEGIIHGDLCSGNGRGSSVLKSVDGVWKIVHEHLSRNP